MPGSEAQIQISIPKLAALLVLIVFLPCQGNAQVDSAYIIPFEQELSTGAYSYYQYTMLTHEIDNKKSIGYKPNSPAGMGVSFAYNSFSVSGGMSFDFMRDKTRGKTKAIDFQYHYYGRKFIFDLFLQNYKGFYTGDNNKEPVMYPDIRLAQYGLYGQYIFNYKKFSHRAAFNQSERQLKSVGSFQLGGGFYCNRVSSDSSLVMYGKNDLNNYQLSISGGYAYIWVIKRNYHISTGMAFGFNFGFGDTRESKKVEVSPSMFPRISAGYSGDHWSLGLSFVLNRMYVAHNDELKMFFDTGYAQIAFAWRFDTTPKFIKKIKFLN
ncbi:MAG: DUF4421 domain-containing protein [Bacteroidales bacterium]|jgi:hypothetical protein|nr:DUF4421 domain-containing protein [Bacteroidales bacterium]